MTKISEYNFFQKHVGHAFFGLQICFFGLLFAICRPLNRALYAYLLRPACSCNFLQQFSGDFYPLSDFDLESLVLTTGDFIRRYLDDFIAMFSNMIKIYLRFSRKFIRHLFKYKFKYATQKQKSQKSQKGKTLQRTRRKQFLVRLIKSQQILNPESQ